MLESTINSRGRTTLPKPVREALGVGPRDRVRHVVLDDGQVRIMPVQPISRLFGMLKHEGPTVTLRDTENAIPPSGRDPGSAGDADV